ncbi:MAG TPA: phospholipid carrier-dependent glycosyltransferase [Mycobacteriales bacterium]|nr:phospholipid carrier-dependent glycosyltransferase [Mycobacteriales bacterium]
MTAQRPILTADRDDPPAPPAAARPPAERLRLPMPTDTALSWICTLVVTLLAAMPRFWGLGAPKGKIFDEIYYATEAHDLLQHGYEANPGYLFIVHPPLGKWFIAAGEYVFGYNEVGWRVSSALAGSLCVLILIRVVRRMTRSTMLGCAAGLLLAADGLSFVQSRVALLDIFLTLLVLAGFGCLVVDRDRMRERFARAVAVGGDAGSGAGTAFATGGDPMGWRYGPRPWRLAGGVLLGLSCAVKWSGVYFLAAFAVLSLIWEVRARRAAGVRRPWAATAGRRLPGALFAFGVAPVAAYLASWSGWFLGENSYDRHWGETHQEYWSWLGAPLRGLIHYHWEAYNFHIHLTSFHPYKSTPWSWLVDGRPLSYYYPTKPAPTGCGASQCVREVLAIGTPALWWAFVPALLWMVWWLVSRRDWRAGVVLTAFVAGWAVWLTDPHRTMFLFYMTPLVPFLVMGVTFLLGDVLGRADAPPNRRSWGLIAVCGYVALVLVDFAWLHPLLVGSLLSYDQWHARIWFPSWI